MEDLIVELKGLLGNSAVIEAGLFPELERAEGAKFRPVLSLHPKR